MRNGIPAAIPLAERCEILVDGNEASRCLNKATFRASHPQMPRKYQVCDTHRRAMVGYSLEPMRTKEDPKYRGGQKYGP